MNSFKNSRGTDAQDILDSIIDDFCKYIGKKEDFHDDLTVIVMKKK